MRELTVNERKIVELIVSNGSIARVDLAEKSGLTGASVTRIIASLGELDLLTETPDKAGLKGQPKRLLSLKPKSYFSVGFTFSLRSLELALVDATGEVIETQSVKIPGSGATQISEVTQKTVEQTLKRTGIKPDRVIGIGCAMPGNFGVETELRAHEVFADMDDKIVLQDFIERLGMPFHMDNDGNSAALGEFIFGAQPEDGISPYLIHLGHGVGGGVISDGRPFGGSNGNAGLPGFLYPYGAPRPSGLDLVETLNRAGHTISDFRDIETLGEDNSDISAWCVRAGDQLRLAIRAATAFLDPSIIIIGGRLPLNVTRKLVDEIAKHPVTGPSRGLSVPAVRSSVLGPSGGAVGAACLPFFNSFFSGARADQGSPYMNGKLPPWRQT